MKEMRTRKEKRALRKQDIQRRLKRKSRATLITYAVIRVLILAVMIRALVAGRMENVFTCLLSLLLLYLPSIIERKLEMRLPTALEITVIVFIFASEILGEIACFYVTVPFWDKAMHTVSGFIYAAVGYSMADILNRDHRISFRLSPVFLAVVAFCFSMTIGALWEIFEFSVDVLLNKDMQKDTVLHEITSVALDPTRSNIPITVSGIRDTVVNGQSLGLGGYLDIGLHDTMQDLIVNMIGALVFSVGGFFQQKRKKRSKMAEYFAPVADAEEAEPHE